MALWEKAIAHVEERSSGAALGDAYRITLNFHPDRAVGDVPILVSLAEDGVYRSQFSTGTSNGGLTAHPGGDRWNWESRIFGGAYDDAEPSERPVYGGLNFRLRSVGASARFGSAHFRLRPETVQRCTFCYPDSAAEPEDFGTAHRMALVEMARADQSRIAVDDYIEAHVHGKVLLDKDIEALVLDPCYRGTEVEAAAEALPCALEWHGGFRLAAEEMRKHPEFRGPEFVELGRRIAVDGILDPKIIGDRFATGEHDPQALKYVWHYLACFGSPDFRSA